MKVEATLSRRETVTLEPREILQVVETAIYVQFGITRYCSIKNGNLVMPYGEEHGSFDYSESPVIRKATKIDEAVLRVLGGLLWDK